ncbi:predicted protein [Nematostella vectensis]|uniref:C-type lectin domain-containing protein n=1 Tax=Nematostella vectensis TaxID=45351 RepID=A7SD50_NEMVE|nr:predicted protein [Nematostella vectensis]|eukprot:XP_001630444.1 predicted protein [Nematostella vectensis]
MHLSANVAQLKNPARLAMYCDPCFSNPCLNGGTCTADQSNWTYRCSCGVSFSAAPYLDDHCGTGSSHIEAVELVYLRTSWANRYVSFFFESGSYQGTKLWLGSRRVRCSSKTSSSQRLHYIKGPTSCSQGSLFHNDKEARCLLLQRNSHVRWEEASRACHVHGGVMGVFNSIDKLDFVSYHVPTLNNSISRIFVGLRKTGGVWTWSYNNLTPGAQLWESDAPASQGPLGAVTIATGRLVDVPDSGDHKLPFVCEKNLP